MRMSFSQERLLVTIYLSMINLSNLIIRHGKGSEEVMWDIWEKIFHLEYYKSDVIEKYQDELGWAELHPKGRVLIYNKQSGFSIGMTKVVEK